MFTSQEWTSSKWAKEIQGKNVAHIVLMLSFWTNIVYSLKVASPLIRVLKLVDGEKRPPMGYIYEAMERAKEAIAKAFGGNEEKYKDIFEIIDRSNPNIEQDEEVMGGLYQCIERLVPTTEVQDKISLELSRYMKADGLFGSLIAVDKESQGHQLHSKKRNRLTQCRLNDLVFIKYNRALKRRYDMRDRIDPILLNDIDDSNEWLVGIMDEDVDAENELVFEDDCWTWGAVARATGAGLSSHNLISRSAPRATKRTTPSCLSSLRIIDDGEANSEDTEEEEDAEGYKSFDGDDDETMLFGEEDDI
ncbi:uncharacterized protein LOC132272735 [Cornus florida]|uniref:uncharacterized protein LOC132272735 n=1 Tax=Cornus florida TaxID=4283 RepID=UPI0028A1CD4E|nr:uncharacterized protein LOC132272735 [Cornus florida]